MLAVSREESARSAGLPRRETSLETSLETGLETSRETRLETNRETSLPETLAWRQARPCWRASPNNLFAPAHQRGTPPPLAPPQLPAIAPGALSRTPPAPRLSPRPRPLPPDPSLRCPMTPC